MLCWTLHLDGQERHPQAAVALGNLVYTCGGNCFGWNCFGWRHLDVHILNTVSLSWKRLQPKHLPEVPTKRDGHTAVLMGRSIYIWGGLKYMGGSCNELYAFHVDTERWSQPEASGAVPEKRIRHSACVLGEVMYIYGGYTTVYTNDIYKLDAAAMVWSLVAARGTLAQASSRHSATIIGTKMFVFGGQGNHGDHDKSVGVFDTETNHWLVTPPSAERFLPKQHSAFAHNGELYVFGAYDSEEAPFSDLWKFNLENLSWKRLEPKGKSDQPRSRMSSVCCCRVGERIVLFGGDNKLNNGLYVLDLRPSLKTLCKLAVVRYELEQSGLPHNVRWELAAVSKQQPQQKKVIVRNNCGGPPGNSEKKTVGGGHFFAVRWRYRKLPT